MKPDDWLAKMRITVTLEAGQKVTPEDLAKLVTAPEDVTKMQKRIRDAAQRPVGYRDTSTNQKNKSHVYDAATATDICAHLRLPVKFKYK